MEPLSLTEAARKGGLRRQQIARAKRLTQQLAEQREVSDAIMVVVRAAPRLTEEQRRELSAVLAA